MLSKQEQAIDTKVRQGVRLDQEDGLALLATPHLSWLGELASLVKHRKQGNRVYFNVNRHINLTNICQARCRFCAFGCDETASQAYAYTKDKVLNLAKRAAQDPDLKELHIVSGLHTSWSFDYYVNIISSLKQELPHIHLKAFTAVEICHFAKISGLSFRQVLSRLKKAGLASMPGGGAEIFSSRVRKLLCPNKASAQEWLEISATAHQLGIPTNATMLYGHIESPEERIDHLIQLRQLQDETGGFQTFIGLPFHHLHTPIETETKAITASEKLRMIAVARLMLDNFDHIKAYWIMLTLPIAQVALSFGADDMDGTVNEEKITHAAGGKTAQGLTKESLIQLISSTGYTPVERTSTYDILHIYHD